MSTQASSTGMADGFFGLVKSVGGDLLGSVTETFNQVLPVWVNRELDLQSDPSRLTGTNFQQTGVNPRIDRNSLQTTSQQSPVQNGGNVQKAFLDFNIGGTRISGLAIALGVVGIAGVIFALRKWG